MSFHLELAYTGREESSAPTASQAYSPLMADGMVVLTTPSSDVHLLLNFLWIEWQNKHFYVLFFFGLIDISLKKI